MIEIEKPNISTVNMSEDGKFGKFIVEPLERGYGTTCLLYTSFSILRSRAYVILRESEKTLLTAEEIILSVLRNSLYFPKSSMIKLRRSAE